MSLYLPKNGEVLNKPSDEDVKYAQAFDLIADVLERSGQKEKLNLLLSTGRNGFLTINALFIDLRLVLGHGKKPSLLSQAIYFLKERETERCKKCLNEASLPLSEYERKRSLWNERHKWMQLLDATIDAIKPNERDRVRRILTSVRTTDPDRDQHWDGKFYALSTDEPALVTEALQTLDSCFAVLDAIVSVCKGVCGLSEETSLFESAPNARLETVFDILAANASALGIATSCQEIAGPVFSLAWNTSNDQVRWARNDLHSLTDTALIDAILNLIDARLGEQYDVLTKVFRPNVSVPPLPPPYCIDLTEVEHGAEGSQGPVAKPLRFGLERPAKIRVALPWVGIPLEYYNTATMRLLDSKRTEVEHVARGLLMSAIEEHAHVLVLPEYFLPRTAAEDLSKVAADSGIILIAGMEGQPVGDKARIRNEALIQLPNQKYFTQSKTNPSVYERPLESKGEILVFNGTSLGTFAVIICSDLLDWHVVHALAKCGIHLDALFVCTCNPSSIFEHLAAADAYRFYCHVIIANNAMDKDGKLASGKGTLVASPNHPPLIHFEKLTGPKAVTAPAIGGCQPQVACIELSIQGLATDRVKPTDGLAAFPPWRNAIAATQSS